MEAQQKQQQQQPQQDIKPVSTQTDISPQPEQAPNLQTAALDELELLQLQAMNGRVG
jgi:hypothetical protein